MEFNPPYYVRAILYIITALGTPIVAYLFAKHHIGELEVTLWSAEVAVVNAMAALNVTAKKKDPPVGQRSSYENGDL